jgi:hypothetical protein
VVNDVIEKAVVGTVMVEKADLPILVDFWKGAV